MGPIPDLRESDPLLAEGDLGKVIARVVPKGRPAFPEQQKPATRPQGQADEGYVRLRVRYDRGVLTPVHAKKVEGPLVQSALIDSGHVYEVTSEGRRVALEWLPDAGISRAFANIDQPEAHLGHEGTRLESFEFIVRIPLGELTSEVLPKVQIGLHYVTRPPEAPLTPEPLATQLGSAVSEVARLSSLDIARLEPQVQVQLSQILSQR
jgi:hypothetical protein